MYKHLSLIFSLSNRRDSFKLSNIIHIKPSKNQKEKIIFNPMQPGFRNNIAFLGGSQACPFVFPVTAISGCRRVWSIGGKMLTG